MVVIILMKNMVAVGIWVTLLLRELSKIVCLCSRHNSNRDIGWFSEKLEAPNEGILN